MAHFAQLDPNNVVIQVIVVSNETIQNLPFPESDSVGVAFCQSLFGADTVWRQTSYNANFRKNYAGKGYVYDAARDAFIAPQPYPSWVLNEATCAWQAPIAYPVDATPPRRDPVTGEWTEGVQYTWEESTLSWVRVG